MKIVIATPLFPPDIGGAASYVKELALRLAQDNDVVVLMYGRLPESVEGVRFICIDKRRPIPIRLASYTIALFAALKNADILYAENGPSIELPVIITRLLRRRSLIIHIGDAAAYARARKHVLLRLLQWLALRSTETVLTEAPPERPEISPFGLRQNKKIDEYNESWQEHLRLLTNTFKHAGR